MHIRVCLLVGLCKAQTFTMSHFDPLLGDIIEHYDTLKLILHAVCCYIFSMLVGFVAIVSYCTIVAMWYCVSIAIGSCLRVLYDKP